MRLTIIRSDGTVIKDGVVITGLDLSFLDPSIHAVQWYGESGEIEYRGGSGARNETINSVEQFQSAIDLWQAVKTEIDNIPPPPPPVPTVTPRQARLALHAAGLLEQVEAAIAAADKTTQLAWEYAIEFRRDDPLINSLGQGLGLTSEQIDQLFVTAETL